MEFPTDTDHTNLPNTTEQIKQQSIHENKLFIETKLKKNERDVKTLENLNNDTKHDLIKTFIDPSNCMIVDDITNVNNWVKKSDNTNQDQDVQQNYNETVIEMIPTNNSDLLSQMISNNEIRDQLILEKNTVQKEHESKQLAEKIQPDLGVFLRDENEPSPLPTELINELSFKSKRSKHLLELNRKSKIKRRNGRSYQRNKKK